MATTQILELLEFYFNLCLLGLRGGGGGECNIPIFYLDVLHLEHVHFIMASFENFAFARLHLFPKEVNPKPYFEL